MASVDVGVPRAPHWERLRRFFETLPRAEYARRVDSARRIIKENGVTYNLYDDAEGMERPWQLDVVPYVIDAAEWRFLEAAVAQRARLANAILRDLYGPQDLIADRRIPPHLVFGHPQYLRALQGARPVGDAYVHLFAADLARDASGRWTVLANRVDAPGGVGYALENRIVSSQTLPELFRELAVQRLASFFADYRAAVLGLARATPGRAVLLTPGPYNEAYFEHAYLANYLGLELVEGEDLAARDGRVYLRTIGGLAPVAGIFRRLDSDFCDPVELRADSALGIPGLVDAVRAGGVTLANALGGGVVESPALNAYLPGAARFFGEELLVPDVPTIWCGTAWGRAAALERLAAGRGIVRDAFDARPLFSRGSTARLGSALDAAGRAELTDLFERRGATVVVHDLVPLGTSPTFENGAFTTRPASLRVFAAWTPNGYVVMPGGLARVAPDDGLGALSMQSGAASKDIWVLAPGQVDMFSLLRPVSDPVDVRRSGNEAPSRAMDNLFWLGRYVERTENLVRILRAIVSSTGGDRTRVVTPGTLLAEHLLLPFQRWSAAGDGDAGEDGARLAARLQSAAFGDHPQSLAAVLGHVAHTAWAVRDRLSLDTWRAVLALTAKERADAVRGRFEGAAAQAYLAGLLRRTAAIAGLAAENMTRGNNWLFFDLGRRIERAALTCDLVRRTLLTADSRESDYVQIALEIADSSMTYRYRYLNAFQAAPALDLLLLDASNPRAAAFQVRAIARHLAALPAETDVQRRGRARELAGRALAAVTGADAVSLASVTPTGYRPGLGALLEATSDAMAELSDAIGVAYFRHATHDVPPAPASQVRE